MEVPSVRSRTLVYVVVGAVVWSAALWVFWVSEPLTDKIDVLAVAEQVAAEADDTLAEGEPLPVRTVTATCGQPWQSAPGPTPPLPELAEGEAYAHDPCQVVHRDNRLVLLMNAVVVLGALIAVAVLTPRRIRTPADADEAMTSERTTVG